MTARRAAATAALLVAALAACSGGPADVPVDPDPVVVGEPAPTADVDPRSLPETYASSEVLSLGWDTTPLERDGIFLGMRAAEGDAKAKDEPLEFVAADADGTVLWRARRSPACTSFALSEADGRPIAVLLEAETTDDALAGITATAYDLATGEQRWGPVPVPGPLLGPGLVFAPPAPAAALGRTGPRVVLDPATGHVLRSEGDEPGTAIVGEYDGVVLSADDEVLTATGPDGKARWTLSRDELDLPSVGGLAAVPAATPPAGTALVGAAGADSGTLVDLQGTVLATGVQDARRDPASGAVVTRHGTSVSGHVDGQVTWTRELGDDVRLAGAGGVLAYVHVGDALHVLNVLTGRDAAAYAADRPDRVAVPEVVADGGGAVVRLDEHYLVTAGGSDHASAGS